MRQKHGLLLFLTSCVPGCGEMYQGYMKRGMSILTIFCGIFALAVFLEIGALAVLMLPVWLFSFFDSYNLRAQADEDEGRALQRPGEVQPGPEHGHQHQPAGDHQYHA